MAGIPWDLVLIIVLLSTVVPWRGLVRVRELLSRPTLSGAERIRLYASTMVLQWAIVSLSVWRCFARDFTPAQLGLSLAHPLRAVIIGLLLASILATTQLIGFRQMTRVPVEQRGHVYRVACM